VFAIAERFPIEARKFAAGLSYTKGYYSPRCADGRCPMGAMLYFMAGKPHSPTKDGPAYYAPASGVIASRLVQSPDQWAEIMNEAHNFINAWDDNKIPDLAEALGVGEDQ